MRGPGTKLATRRSRRGAALVEMVIVILVLFMLVFGMIELGHLTKDNLALNQVAREAARSAAVGSGATTVTARAKSWAQDLGLNQSELAAPVIKYTNPDTGVAYSPGTAPPGSEVQVTLTYGHKRITGILPFLPEKVNVTTTMVMRLE